MASLANFGGIAALIAALNDAEPALHRETHLALRASTNHDFDEDRAAWREWWNSHQR